MKRLSLALLSLVLSGAASAQKDGNELLRYLQDQPGFLNGVGAGFAVGVASALNRHSVICIPSGVENGQIISVVERYLVNRPERRQESPLDLTEEALIAAWPCRAR